MKENKYLLTALVTIVILIGIIIFLAYSLSRSQNEVDNISLELNSLEEQLKNRGQEIVQANEDKDSISQELDNKDENIKELIDSGMETIDTASEISSACLDLNDQFGDCIDIVQGFNSLFLDNCPVESQLTADKYNSLAGQYESMVNEYNYNSRQLLEYFDR